MRQVTRGIRASVTQQPLPNCCDQSKENMNRGKVREEMCEPLMQMQGRITQNGNEILLLLAPKWILIRRQRRILSNIVLPIQCTKYEEKSPSHGKDEGKRAVSTLYYLSVFKIDENVQSSMIHQYIYYKSLCISYQLSRLYYAEHAKGRRLYLRCKNIFKPLVYFGALEE